MCSSDLFNCSVSGADLNSDGLTDVLIGLYGGGAQIYYQVDPLLGVNEITTPVEFTVFPNPASDELNIALQRFSPKEHYSLTLFNCMGQAIMQQNEVKEKLKVDVSNFAQGIYLLQLRTEQGSVSRKVVIGKR